MRLLRHRSADFWAGLLMLLLLAPLGPALVRALREHPYRPPPAVAQPALPPAPRPEDVAALVLKQRPGAESAWPGYRAFSLPLLLSVPGQRSLLLRGDGTTRPIARGYDPGVFYEQAFDLDGSTVTYLRLPPLLTTERAARTFLHERFHAYQHDHFQWPAKYEPYLVEDTLDMGLAGAESVALARWAKDSSLDAMRDFAAARLRRRALFPQGKTAELWEERNEGTAKYVELAGLSLSAGAAAVRKELARELMARLDPMALHKWREYQVGAAACFWLEEQRVPGWRRSVEQGRSPTELVVERLKLPPAEVERRVALLTASPGYKAYLGDARRMLEALRRRRAELRARMDSLPGRRLVLTSSATLGGFSGDWTDFPDGSNLLIVAEYSVDRPELKLRLTDEKGIWRRTVGGVQENTFVVPPEARLTLDGGPWTPRPGRYAFERLSIREQRITLDAGPGVLEDDGKYLRLSFPGKK